jgi:hypothetical protein
MSEASFRRGLISGIKKIRGDASAHEDAYTAGIPDMSFCLQAISGWIECKTADWPKRETTKVKLKHPISYQQRNWIVRRQKAGCPCFVFVKAGRDVFVLAAWQLDSFMEDGWTQSECEERSLLFWHNRLDWITFIDYLKLNK